jgi:hypothetical protein
VADTGAQQTEGKFPMTELAEVYQAAENLVIQRYATKPDKDGRPQFWRVKAILEDRKNHNLNSRTLQTFAEDVDAMVTDLLTQKSNIIYSTMNSSSAPVASLEPVKPAKPHGKKETNPPLTGNPS